MSEKWRCRTKRPLPARVWNRIPDTVRDRLLTLALNSRFRSRRADNLKLRSAESGLGLLPARTSLNRQRPGSPLVLMRSCNAKPMVKGGSPLSRSSRASSRFMRTVRQHIRTACNRSPFPSQFQFEAGHFGVARASKRHQAARQNYINSVADEGGLTYGAA